MPPSELENIILTHPAVADVGVVGVPDLVAGELPMAWVVKKPNAKVTEKDIADFVAGKSLVRITHKHYKSIFYFIFFKGTMVYETPMANLLLVTKKIKHTYPQIHTTFLSFIHPSIYILTHIAF